MAPLYEEFLPLYDVSDELAVVADAAPSDAWQALLDVDLIELGKRVPLVGALGAIRILPELVTNLLHGETPANPPDRVRLADMGSLPRDQGGWVFLGQREEEEIALGLVGKFWRPVIEYAQVGPEAFADWSEPGYAKTVYALGVRPVQDGRTLIWGTMRTATTDDHARRWFRRYWTFGVGSGAHVLVHALLEAAREGAERGSAAERSRTSTAR